MTPRAGAGGETGFHRVTPDDVRELMAAAFVVCTEHIPAEPAGMATGARRVSEAKLGRLYRAALRVSLRLSDELGEV